MKRTAAHLCLLITLHAFAQKDRVSTVKDKVTAQKDRVNVKLCIPCLIDFVNFPTIQAGIEYRLSSRIGWYNEVGIGYLPALRRPDSTFIGTRGFKLKTELRYYYKKTEEARSMAKEYYFGINAFYTNNSYNTQITYYPGNDTAVDGYGVSKKVLGGNLLMGIQIKGGRGKFAKRFSFDIYEGLGIRLRWINTINKDVGESDIHWAIDFPNAFRLRKEPEIKGGFSILPNVTAGIRLCYRL